LQQQLNVTGSLLQLRMNCWSNVTAAAPTAVPLNSRPATAREQPLMSENVLETWLLTGNWMTRAQHGSNIR
jgi:hypothetical protein